MEVVKALLSSKKFITAMVTIAGMIGVRYLGMTEEQATELGRCIMGVGSTLILGQGAADLGKEGKTREADGMVALAEAAAGFPEDDEDEG